MSFTENNISNSQPEKTFSVIVPTYARPQQLSQCLQALAGSKYPKDRFEVIVVNDGAETNPTYDVLTAFKEKITVKFFTQTNSGPAAARNTGAAHANGEYLAFTDDDCAPASDWLSALAKRLGREPNHAIGGQTINALSNNLYSTASQILVSYLYAYYHSDSVKFIQPRFFTSNNLALPSAQFHRLQGFNETLRCAEDRDLCERWLHAGYGLRYASEVRVLHYHELTLNSFWQQHFNYGRGNFSFHQLCAKRGRGRFKLEPQSFYWNMLGYPFSKRLGTPALSVSLLLLLSQLANLIGCTYQWLDQALQRKVTFGESGNHFRTPGLGPQHVGAIRHRSPNLQTTRSEFAETHYVRQIFKNDKG